MELKKIFSRANKKKYTFLILRYSALAIALLIIDGTLGFKYSIIGFLIYVFIIPVVVLFTKWKQVKFLYLHALHHLYKALTGKEVIYRGLYNNVIEEEDEPRVQRKQRKQKPKG